MSSRPGQAGAVYQYRKKWIGQWLEDVPGHERRIRKSLTLGLVRQMTKATARHTLQEHIEKLGVNTAEHLERSQTFVVTFDQAADRYETGRLQDLKPSTRRTIEHHLRKYLRPYFCNMSLDKITADVICGAVRTWAKDEMLSHNSLRHIVTTLGSVVGRTFGKAIKFPSQIQVVNDAEEPCFTPEQMSQIIALAKQPHYVSEKRDWSYVEGYAPCSSAKMKAQADASNRQMSAFFAAAAGTGMRSGELCGLRVEDVDLDKGIISVRRAAWEGTEQTPKTPNAVRKIGIDAEVVRILREQLGNRRFGYVFQARNGNPLRESNILRRHLHPVLKKLKIPMCGLHAFRHGRVSFLVENNVPLPMIRLWIGHGSDKMVQRYTHARPEFHANVIASLPSIANSANMKTEAA